MAHRKAGGSTQLGRDSKSQRLGIKKFAGEQVKAGNIIVRQRGTKYHLGSNVKQGSDDTIFAVKEGVVEFRSKMVKKFNGQLKKSCFVGVKTH